MVESAPFDAGMAGVACAGLDFLIDFLLQYHFVLVTIYVALFGFDLQLFA